MPPPSMSAASSTPRVSLVLIAYQQERFIRDAVRSALAQDYPGVDIILSDDCSPDETFETMQAEAGGYQGPHQVTVRQPPRNLGLVCHLFDAAALASGDLIVIAAGDDLSYPQRVRRLADEWRQSGADALFSNWDVVDEAGNVVRRGRPSGAPDLRTDRYFRGAAPVFLAGATAAYSAETFRRIPRPSQPIFAEDLYFSLLLAWRGRSVRYIEEPLVGYRAHAAALTHVDRSGQALVEQERDAARWSGSMAAQLRLVRKVIADPPTALDGWGCEVSLDCRAIDDDIAFNEFRATWLDGRFGQRLHALRRFRDPRQRRWLLPRLFGVRSVALLRRLRATVGRRR